MIVALWLRYRTSGHAKWLAVALAILALDALVGTWIVKWELELIREAGW